LFRTVSTFGTSRSSELTMHPHFWISGRISSSWQSGPT
jgi:hypothetical protein